MVKLKSVSDEISAIIQVYTPTSQTIAMMK